jgi:diketogulonate reductase-like aldo/keto reductase
VFAIPKAGRPEHAAENAAAAHVVLTAADVARIERAFPRGRRPRELPTL